MKKVICLAASLFIATFLIAKNKDSLINYNLPDSVKAISFIASVQVQGLSGNPKGITGIQTSQVTLSLKVNRNQGTFIFKLPLDGKIIATGLDVRTAGNNELSWQHDWSNQESYKLFITTAADSAENFILYSGYIYFPKKDKWKLIGTCKINGYENTIKEPKSFFTEGKESTINAVITDAWCQRNNGSWKQFTSPLSTPPVIIPLSNIDSIRQAGIDVQLIQSAIASGKTDAVNNKKDLYYTILKKGNGKEIMANDSVTIFYKGYLFSDGTLFDETKDKPSTYALNRLILGWQQGVPLVKTGGKIKLLIPSGLAYNIRTRAAKIPPNSILVFEIEVVDSKAN